MMDYLYHGVMSEDIDSLKAEGINPNSYWGDSSEASNYTDCNLIIKIDPYSYSVYPNHTLINYYESSGEDLSLLQEWEESNKNWKDSLRIFGSVIIEDRVFFDEEDLISI